MRKGLLTYLSIICLLVSGVHFAQISPGDLAEGHKQLEGIKNCTQCHDLGKKVSSTKCLDCHKEIQTLIDNNKGYHANKEVVNKECVECHSDHHGRKFDMMRFDQENFDHNLTGYELEGKHNEVDCKKCHTPDYIQDLEIKKREGTFLGLVEDCLSCHDDFHQETLSNDCMSCHDMEGWEPASKFNHDDTDYPLTGKHIDVDCIECHQITEKNGVKFQEFADVDFADCVSCHKDPHNNQLQGSCTACHTEDSFQVLKKGFNHNRTDFTLKGAHKAIDCYTCHAENKDPELVFQDVFESVDENNCISCHEDVHEGKYGTSCVDCHSEESFFILKNEDQFNHNLTDYPLEGKHTNVDCKECHTTPKYSDAIDFSQCQNCHTDYHLGEFKNELGISPDCKECHTVDFGFDYSTYTIEQHKTTEFPLKGAHVATPCFACHIDEKEEPKWHFKNIDTACVDCHENIHEEYINEKYYPKENCESCHNNDNWTSINFDHNLTDWALTGKHIEVNCKECHYQVDAERELNNQIFKGLNTDCITCHENIHGKEFEKNGVTVCVDCHITESWFPTKFNHDETQFPLEGKHAEIECKECHQIQNDDGTIETIYKIKKFECIDCHS